MTMHKAKIAWGLACAGMVLAFITPPLHAADMTYIPEGCEFRMTLPEAPSTAEACNPDNPKECYRTGRFTRVYALDSVLKISTTCNNAEQGMMDRYSGEVMAFTLKTMSKGKVDEPESGYQEFAYAKQALIMGGKKLDDGAETLYMAQLWIGKKSVFTVEGEVTGAANDEADALFTAIMASIRHESLDQAQDKKSALKPDDTTQSGAKTPEDTENIEKSPENPDTKAEE